MRPLMKRLALERRRRGLNQVQLAAIVQCDWSTISNLERGTIVIPSGRLSHALERFFSPLTLGELLADVDPAQLGTH